MAKEEEKLYKFSELSEEAKEHALEEWRDKGYDFDDFDSQDLTEQFKETLKEKGFYDPKVYWSLGYCQGDGVCFEGAIDPEELFNQKGFSKFKELIGHVGIKVRTPGNSCHSNSMDVEVEFQSGYAELMDRDMLRRIEAWEEEQSNIRRGRPSGVLEWSPGEREMPSKYARALEQAKKKEAKLIKLTDELQEKTDEWVGDLSRELERIGYSEIEYRSSDEAITEQIEANDYKFTEDGEVRF